VLVNRHGPFTWGKSPIDAVRNAVFLEQIAQTCYLTETLNPQYQLIDNALLERRRERQSRRPLVP
jgi:L-ribulose-5-phosphate 4-epimerase